MAQASLSHIRNFAIVAHIDHGKSTLADRLLEITGLLDRGANTPQVLDDLDLERERGITIKARAVRMPYTKDGKSYVLNLIDTPGHVDFSYEVSRSLAACEGAILLVDATQGVEAQTVANAYLAVEAGLEILPVINKVDVLGARPAEVIEEMHAVLGIAPEEVLACSAKTGQGVQEVLDRLIDVVPAPVGDPEAPLRALLFDAIYDTYRGVVIYVRLIDGILERGMKIRLVGTRQDHDVTELGVLSPHRVPVNRLSAGESGYLVASIKSLEDVNVGDTVTTSPPPKDLKVLPGYREPQPMVYCGLYPTYPKDFEALRRALQTLRLNDASFTFIPESSEALGFGFRCGFLGLLHMEIVQERLERDSDVDLVQTAPNVTYEVLTRGGDVMRIEKPSDVPDPSTVEEFREPIARCSMIIPHDAVGALMKICTDRRGVYVETQYLSPTRVMLVFDVPLQEIVFDFYDRLKSVTRGYGTLDYDIKGYEASDLVRLRILVNAREVDALSMICHRTIAAEGRGRRVITRLRKAIPRHLFAVALQAAVGGRIVARETISALRKDVTAKCYGGDVTRKRKLLEKQKKGKKRMKQVGNVEIPQDAFLAVLGGDDEKEGEVSDVAPYPSQRSSRPLAGSHPDDEILEPGPLVEAAPSLVHRGLEALKDNLEAFTIALVMALVIKHFCVEAFKIPTGSMYPTLYGESNSASGVGDRILVDKWAYLWNDPARWDVVVFRYPLNQSKHFIKRLVGEGGEWINVVRGDIWVKESADATWHIATKRRRARDELYLPVYPPEDPDPSQSWRRQGLLPPEEWWDGDAGWQVEAYDELVYAGGAPATTRFKKRIGKASDPSSYTFESDRTLVQDVRVRLRARPAGAGRLLLRWSSRQDETVELELRAEEGRSSVLRTRRHGSEREVEIPSALVADAWTAIELECVDGQVYVHVDGQEVLRVDLAVALDDVRRIDDFVQELAIQAEGAALRVEDLRIDRDLYYTGDGMAEFGVEREGIEIPAGHYFMMGDNTEHSSDSRKWVLDGIQLDDGTEIWYESTDPDNRPRYGASGWQSVVDQDGIERRWRREDETSDSRSLHRRHPFVARNLVVGRAFLVFWPLLPDPPGRAGFIH